MLEIDIEQGSPEWFSVRAGKVTASGIANVIAKIKSGEAAARKNYLAQKVAESLSGISLDDGFQSAAMRHGKEWESTALSAYEAERGIFVRSVGFVIHPKIKQAGASPDGLVGDDGLLEIKCPNTATHIDYFLDDEAPAKYKPQMAWQCACTGRKWVDFVSYDPRLPEKMQLAIRRFTPDPGYIAILEMEVEAFSKEVNELIEQLTRKAS